MNYKYAALILTNSSLSVRTAMPLSSDMSIMPSFPVCYESHWERWLGSLLMQQLTSGNMFLVCQKPTASADVLDKENEECMKSTHNLFLALMIVSPISYEDAYLISGAIQNGEASVREVQYTDRYYAVNKQTSVMSNAARDKLSGVYQSLKALFSEEVIREERYFRLRHGITAYLRALREGENYYRIHQFVRSLEAITMPEIGRTRKQFVKKLSYCVDGASDLELGEIYDLRCKVEHIHPLAQQYQDLTEEVSLARINQRGALVEAIARGLFERIISDNYLLKCFESNESIQKFWSSPDGVTKNLGIQV